MIIVCKGGLLSTIVFYVCGTAKPLQSTMKQKNGRQGIQCNRNKKYSIHSFSKLQESFNATIVYQARINEELCESYSQTPVECLEFFCKKFTELSQAEKRNLCWSSNLESFGRPRV